jgi:hypothetical protein
MRPFFVLTSQIGGPWPHLAAARNVTVCAAIWPDVIARRPICGWSRDHRDGAASVVRTCSSTLDRSAIPDRSRSSAVSALQNRNLLSDFVRIRDVVIPFRLRINGYRD